MDTKIKICGLTTEKDVEYINEYCVDFAGFVMFYPKSKRNVSVDKVKVLLEKVSEAIKKVAVVVCPTVEQIETIEKLGFEYIQIHGTLVKESFDAINIPMLRAFNVDDMDNYEIYKNCNKVKGYVFDAVKPGSGHVFDWSLIKEYPKDTKMLVLAGGLNCENVRNAIEFVQPDVVDVSSGVEGINGKDKEKIKKFVRMVRNEE